MCSTKIFWRWCSMKLGLVEGYIPRMCPHLVTLLVRKPTEWLRLFFSPNNLMIITVYQTNTGHRAVSLNNESNAQNKFTFKCWSCHAFNVVHQLFGFCSLCFAIFADEIGLVIFVLQTFSWNHSPIYFVCSLLSSLQPFLSRTGHLVATFFTWNISKHLRHFVL